MMDDFLYFVDKVDSVRKDPSKSAITSVNKDLLVTTNHSAVFDQFLSPLSVTE